MYRQDSFFDLSTWGQIGLAGLSALLFVITLLIARACLAKRSNSMRLVGALVLFWLFVWLSPQVYYQYYRILIEGLPQQWVIWPPASVLDAFYLLMFQGPQNLSAHGQGVLGWSLIAIPFLKRRTDGRRSAS